MRLWPAEGSVSTAGQAGLWSSGLTPSLLQTDLNCPFPPSLAVQNSPKGCHRDKRTQIVYSDDL